MRSSSAFLTLRSALDWLVLVVSLEVVFCVVLCACAPVANASASAAAIEQSLSVMIRILVLERECPVLQTACQDPRALRSAQEPRDQRDQKQHDEYDEQDLRDFRRAGRDAGKAEYCGDDGDDEKCECPAEHGLTPRNCGVQLRAVEQTPCRTA